MNPQAVKKMIRFHCAIPVAVILFYGYTFAMKRFGYFLSGCLFHDWLHLYCPACGGTRALEALLKFNFLESIRYNPLVLIFFLMFLYFYTKSWIRLKRGEERLLIIPKSFWTVCLVLAIVFFVTRNFLLIAFGYDPTGDLDWFWNQIR